MTTSQIISGKSQAPVFAYLRRSTTNKQEISLENQSDNIDLIIKDNGFNKDEIKFFRESRSAYDGIKQKDGKIIRKRTEFTELLKAIDSSKIPCVILVRESSRLSRNEVDSIEIQKRLFGIYGSKIKIEKIIFYGGGTWDSKSEKEKVSQELLNNYHYSIMTGRSSGSGVVAQLRRGYYVYGSPKGLSKIKIGEKIYLEQNEKMTFIKTAFEMKVGGISHKEISKYLKQYGIKIGERELTERIFTNTIYIGSYTHKKTGEVFNNLLFKEGRPPIPLSLWDKVQSCLGRKISLYGEKQEGDIIAEKLRTESGKRMSKYLAKKTYVNYMNDREKIYIAEKAVLSAFLEEIAGFLSIVHKSTIIETGISLGINARIVLYKEGRKVLEADGRDISRIYENFSADLKSDLEKSGSTPEESLSYYITEIGRQSIIRKLQAIPALNTAEKVEGFTETLGYTEEAFQNNLKQKTFVNFSEMVGEKYSIDTSPLKKAKQEQIAKLQKEKEEAERQKKEYRKNAVLAGFNKEEIDETTKDIENSIKRIEEQINEFSDNTDMEKYLERLPDVLLKTFELASNAIQKAKVDSMREDTLLLLELTTFELTVNNKKELKVKLFDVLDRLVKSDFSILEAPSGVEPLSTALQAAV